MDAPFTIHISYTVKEAVRGDYLTMLVKDFSQLRRTCPPGDPYCSKEVEDDNGTYVSSVVMVAEE